MTSFGSRGGFRASFCENMSEVATMTDKPEVGQIQNRPTDSQSWPSWWRSKNCHVTENVQEDWEYVTEAILQKKDQWRRWRRRCSRHWTRCPPAAHGGPLVRAGGCALKEVVTLWRAQTRTGSYLMVWPIQLNRRGPIWVQELAPWLFSVSLAIYYSPHVLITPDCSVWNKCTKGNVI